MEPTRSLLLSSLTVLALAAALPAGDRTSPLKPLDLRCEYLRDPLCVEETRPRLSWRLESRERGQRQSAYRILVASTPQLLAQEKGDLWDSGRVASDRTAQVEYAGRPLGSRQQCFWKVRSWDRSSRPGAWSEPARWAMGLLAPSDWQARWISHRDPTPLHTRRDALYLPPPRQYRREFRLDRPVRRAVLYASALGVYEFRVNGRAASDHWFAPGWSDYRRRAYYRAYDVTRLLQQGPNALGALLAEGWYSGYLGYGLLVGYGPNRSGRYFYGKTPALLAQLEVELSDGTRQVVGTGADWKVTASGPIREADFLMGEHYDARREMPGWDRPGFDDGGWEAAIPAEANGSTRAPFVDSSGTREVELGFSRPARLQAYPGVPVRVTEEIRPVRVLERPNGVWIFDLGQNFAGVVRLSVRGEAGTRIRLRYGEMLHPDGRLMTENLRRARAEDTYVLRGDPGGENWSPRFTSHGFQFVEVTGYPGRPGPEAVTGLVLHSDTPMVSSFECSDPMANRLFRNITYTQRANFLEVPTDCPQRDERLGWMGDAQIYVRAAAWNADVAAFFTKWLDDVEEAQLPNGAYPDYCPYPMFHGGPAGYGTAWMDAGILCPYTIWQVYGDTRVLSRHWDSMTRFMEFRRKRSPTWRGARDGNAWGDWLSLGQTTPLEFIDAVYFAVTAARMAEMAAALGKADEATRYGEWRRNIETAWKKDYLLPDGRLSVDTQTACALALWAELVPADRDAPVPKQLEANLAANGYRMATGFLGTRPLVPVLSRTGRHDLAARLFQSRKFPSWGYEIENGATSIWERWNSFTKDKGFGDAGMNSFSHYAFGAVCEWMFSDLAGIETAGPGFRRLLLRPGPPAPGSNPDQEPVHWVRASYESPAGRVVSSWRRDGERFLLEVTVPTNCTARLYFPARNPGKIREGDRPVGRAAGVRVIGTEGDRVVLELQSGSYRFAADP